ncbi:MAG: hypothetical protein BWY76_02732 [bacterium ADurb.Bin429]|nr:MAG: hypothetical protein BWY76_02732 [bacterium ADurb.Bin429]
MLHRLVSGAIFAEGDAVVGEDEDDADAHQRRQSHGRPHVVGEGEEGGCVGQHPTVTGHAIGNGAHCVFAHTEMQIAATMVIRAEVAAIVNERFRARCQVGGAAYQHGQARRQRVNHLARRAARGDGLAP